ncbi:hypothetical protein [Streptomyces sp. NPDC003299]
MSTAAFNALFAQVAPSVAPIFSLAQRDRRPAGADFPTIPAGGLCLSVSEAAAALFETEADTLADPVPSTDALHGALTAAVTTLGADGIAEILPGFETLESEEFPQVATCRHFAYRLALSFWYEGARSRPMTAGEAAVALYLSDAYRHHQVDALTVRRAPLLVSRAVRQGAALAPGETLVRLGTAIVREFATPVTPTVTQVIATAGRDWLYQQALPDYHRRRFCFDLMRGDTRQPTPLIVRPDSGGYLLGITPPAAPNGTWTRALRAKW